MTVLGIHDLVGMVKCPPSTRLHSVITQRPESENKNVLEEEKQRYPQLGAVQWLSIVILFTDLCSPSNDSDVKLQGLVKQNDVMYDLGILDHIT
jgi:hypothetical protein